MPWQSAPLTPLQRDFCVRYYRWAQEQWERELDHDFPMLRAAAQARVVGSATVLTLFERAGARQRRDYAQVLLKRVHHRAAVVLGEPMSYEEAVLLKRFDRQRQLLRVRDQVMASFATYGRRAGAAAVLDKASLVLALRRVLEPTVGTLRHDPSGPYALTTVAHWEVQTNFEAGSTRGALRLDYSHDIRLGSQPGRFLARGISGLSWLGAGACRWSNPNAAQLAAAVAYIDRAARQFFEAAPELLPAASKAP